MRQYEKVQHNHYIFTFPVVLDDCSGTNIKMEMTHSPWTWIGVILLIIIIIMVLYWIFYPNRKGDYLLREYDYNLTAPLAYPARRGYGGGCYGGGGYGGGCYGGRRQKHHHHHHKHRDSSSSSDSDDGGHRRKGNRNNSRRNELKVNVNDYNSFDDQLLVLNSNISQMTDAVKNFGNEKKKKLRFDCA